MSQAAAQQLKIETPEVSKWLFGDVISEARHEARRAILMALLPLPPLEVFEPLAEQLYYELLGEAISYEVTNPTITSEALAEAVVNKLGYCFCRVGHKLIVED